MLPDMLIAGFTHRQLRDVDQAVLLSTELNESTELLHLGLYTWNPGKVVVKFPWLTNSWKSTALLSILRTTVPSNSSPVLIADRATFWGASAGSAEAKVRTTALLLPLKAWCLRAGALH